MLEQIQAQARQAAAELLETAKLKEKDLFVVGCSSSEIGGERIGTHSSTELAQAVLDGIYPLLKEHGVFLAAQCCEHLNRAIILEKEAAEWYRLPAVNAVPQPKAGGSFATAAYSAFRQPVAVEQIQAQAGMDIGGTLIGMHLAPVAVPVRLSLSRIGEAGLICARTRPKYIGGERTRYDSELG
ncbi:MAG: TIGR01440 family protein [Oscillospiraceae bacterium]